MNRQTVPTWCLRTTAALLVTVLVSTPAWGAIFTDIIGLPAQRAIERLAAKGIFRMTSDGKFNPAGGMPRIEFAVLLARVLGLSGQGVPMPGFKDAGEIPREMQAAVAAVANLGTVSPTKIELRRGPVLYTLTTDKGVYGPTDPVELLFVVANTGTEDVKFEFANSQLFDFVIRGGDGVEVARWSLGRAFLPVDAPITLAAGKSFEYTTRWRQLDQNDDPVPPGRYELTAIQTTKAAPTSLSVVLYKGIFGGFPDNTFRPQVEVTRVELAATMVRVLGLGETPSSPPAVSDAADIPESLRGAVAVAMEKGVVAALPDRTFRPARPAARADIALALDRAMVVVDRYDFSKGTLKDIRVGTPTLIVIEEQNKAQRTFRVARASAVYRNNAAAELVDLRAGDALLFLKVGDVGDVAYIEATAR